jgi:hypothetical protein
MLTKMCKVTASIQEKLLKNQVVVIQSGGPDYRYHFLLCSFSFFRSQCSCISFVVTCHSRVLSGRCVDSIIACLLLLSMDPYYRTIAGFCELLRKEWFLEGYRLCLSPLSFIYLFLAYSFCLLFDLI